MMGGSVSWRMFETWVGGWVVFFRSSWSGGWFCGCGVVCSFLVLRRLASLRSLVSLLSCLLSECVRGVCSFSGSGVGFVCATGQFFCASSFYAVSVLMMRPAALSISDCVTVWESVSLAR